LEQFIGYLTMLGVLGTLIVVHECGHFLVARFFGFQTPVFGIGLPFGPSWALGKRWGTEFRLHAFLLGGYVAIPELGDESNSAEEVFGVKLSPFKKFPIWQRALVAFAGVGFNILFAYLLVFIMLMAVGRQVPGHVMVGAFPKDNPIAMQAGVQVDDQIVGIDDIKIKTSEDVIGYLGKHKSTPIVLHVLRSGQTVDLPMTPNADGRVGMQLESPAIYEKVEGNPIEIAGMAASDLSTQTGQMLGAMGSMLEGLGHKIMSIGKKEADKGGPGLKDFHGVLAVIKVGSDLSQRDWREIVKLTIMISMDLAIVNLFPWPALDGGHLAFMFLEALRGKPMEERAQGEIVKWGFLSLIALMVVVLVNDVSAWVKGDLDFTKKKGQPHISVPTGQSNPK
jgi:regulator of sigma E protease